MIVRATLLLAMIACCFACADHQSPREPDGGRVQPRVDEPDEPDARPSDASEEPKDAGLELGTDASDAGGPVVVVPPVDPCKGATEGFVCNGYDFAVTPIVGNGPIELGHGYAGDHRERFVPEKLVRRACVEVAESMVRRGSSHEGGAISGTDLPPEQVAGQLSIVDSQDLPPELVSYAEHARESAKASTFSFAEQHRGPWQTFDFDMFLPESPEGCGSAFVWSVRYAAALGIIVELAFPTASSRDTFVDAVGVDGIREGLVGGAEASARVYAAAAQTGAYVKLHVASSAGIADEIRALLMSSTCSALNFASCREIFEGVRALFASHLIQDDSKVWETRSPALRKFYTPP